jgi:hypothetical protein
MRSFTLRTLLHIIRVIKITKKKQHSMYMIDNKFIQNFSQETLRDENIWKT